MKSEAEIKEKIKILEEMGVDALSKGYVRVPILFAAKAEVLVWVLE